MADNRSIDDLAEAIADGIAVDWAAVDASPRSPEDRAAITRLKQIGQLVERRRTPADGSPGSAPPPAKLIANPVENRLPQVRLQRTSTLRLKELNSLKRVEQGVLYEVLSVGHIARPARQPAARPSAERLQVPIKQNFKGVGVSRSSQGEQIDGLRG